MKCLVLLALVAVASAGPTTQMDLADSEWELSYVGKTTETHSTLGYRTEIEYSLTVLPGSEYKDLSHLTIDVPNCENVLVLDGMVPSTNTSPNGYDPTTGINGIKWDGGQSKGTTKTYKVYVLSKSPVVMGTRQYAVKGGTRYAVGTIAVPICQTQAVPVCSVGANPNVHLTTCNAEGQLTTVVEGGSSTGGGSSGLEFSWSSDAGVFANPSATETSWSIDAPGCTASFELTLTVTNSNGLTDSCSLTVTFDDATPIEWFGAQFVTPVTAEIDDVPSTPSVSAENRCQALTLSLVDDESEKDTAGSYTLTRTWTATTACSSDSKVQVVNVRDSTPPVLSGVDDDSTADCNSVPPPCEPVALDATQTLINYSSARNDGSCAGTYDLIRTWVATDAAGLASSGTQTISVTDTEAPVLSQAPGDITVACDNIPVAPALTANDACEGLISVTFFEEPTGHDDSSPNSYIITRTWTASDSCGNSVSDVQVVTVQDTEAPVLNGVDDDATYTCNAVPPPCVVEAEDQCDHSALVSMSSRRENGSCQNEYKTIYTWTARDTSGNAVSAHQTVTVVDNVAPELSGVPAEKNHNYECSPGQFVVTAFDNCDGTVDAIETDQSTTSSVCDINYTVERTWTATDGCGNTASDTVTFQVEDSTPPELVGVPSDIVVDCENYPEDTSVTATDTCSEATVTLSEVTNGGSCTHEYSVVQTWTAVDECGNVSDEKRTITVSDTEAPVLANLPGNKQVTCNGEEDPDDVTASDNCDLVSVDYTQDRIDGSCPCEYELIRTWSVTDDCGNGATHVQTITVDDNHPPTITDPANASVKCDADTGAPVVTAEDPEDGELTPALVEFTTTGSCESEYTITRTWTATDSCGNSVTSSHTVEVTDGEVPTLSGVPEAQTEPLEACTHPLPSAGDVTASDNCGPVTLEFNEETLPGYCDSNYVVSRTWDAVDECGLKAGAVTRSYSVVDTVKPELSSDPEDITVDCSANPPVPTVSATDCNAAVSVQYDPTPGSGVCRTDLRKWTATDECGNSATATQRVVFEDNNPPVLSVPADSTIDCLDTLTPPTASATDDCSTPTVTDSYEKISANEHEYTFVATDACGNAATDDTTITVEDTTPPTITVDSDMTLECDEDEGNLDYTADDDCDENPAVVAGDTETHAGACVGDYYMVRSWVVTDHTGRSATDSQTVTFKDRTPPTLVGVPASSTTEYTCEASPPEAPTVTVDDNCDTTIMNVAVMTESTTPGAGVNDYNLVREWTATDSCGNTVSDSQTLSFVDTTPPNFNSGFDQYVDAVCVAPPAPTLTGTDNCGLATVTGPVESTDQGTCDDEYTVTRTWTVEDGNGLTATATQTVSVTDSTNPAWTSSPLPVDVTVYSPSDVPQMPTLEANDNCGVVTVRDNEQSGTGCSPDDQMIVRLYTATDDCGNSITHGYTITVVDNSYPSIEGIPEDDATHACDETYTLPPVTCDGVAVQPALISSSANPTCEHETSKTYEYSCTNACLKYASDTFTVVTTQAGPAIAVIDDNTRECSAQAYAPTTSPSDDCGSPSVSHSSSSDQQGEQLPFDITHTWTVTDDCGQTTQTSAVETVVDTTPPTIAFTSSELAELQAEWGSAPNPTVSMVYSDDNCNRTVTFTSENVTGTCLYAHLMVNTFTATDNAGNTATVTQTVTVEDTTPPVFNWPDSEPSDETHSYETLPYGQVPSAATVTATDPINGDDLTVTFTETSQQGASPEEFTVTRTWTVEDQCGNTNYHQVVITVVNYPLYDTEKKCDEAYYTLTTDEAVLQQWFDGNNPGVQVSGAEATTSGTCPAEYTITRTFTMTDAQGATFTQDYDIAFTDTEAPVFDSYEASSTTECDPPSPDVLTASDNCIVDGSSAGALPSDLVTSVDGTKSNNGELPYSFLRTWTAVDACGHTSTAVQTVNVVDTTAPTVDFMPPDETLECDDASQDPTGQDNCGGEVTVDEILPSVVATFDCESTGKMKTTTRSWRLTDSCGNPLVVSNTVTTVDTTDPSWTSVLPESASYQCEEVIPEKPTAEDTCDATITVNRIDAPVGPGQMEYKWVAQDSCGNSITTSAVITVEDTTPPELTNLPEDKEAECDTPFVSPPTATDNCITVTLEVAVSEVGSCDDSSVITRVWTATDSANNVATYTQVTTVSDTGAPTLNISPEPVDRGCGSLPAPVDPPASDLCDKDALEFNSSDETIPGACGNNYDVVRTWTATDDCGNTDTAPQTFSFDDSAPPTFLDVPGPETVSCDESIPPAEDVNMVDNCAASGPVGAPVETSAGGDCDQERTIIRTWVANDGCNQVTASQTITVEDNDAPVITPPGPESYECDDNIPSSTASVSDTCDTTVALDPVVETTIEATSANDYKLVRTWTASDACGNAATADQTITVSDTTPPTFVNVPVDANWECDNLGSIVPDVNDNCDNATPEGPSVSTNVGTCADEYDLVHTWTATDVSGNIGTWTVTVAVVDTTDPVWVTVPQSSISYECEESPVDKPTASDNCGSDVQVSDVTTTPITQWVSKRTWVATDVCGNSITTSQTVTVTDTTPPTIDGVLDDFEGPCNSNVAYSTPTADDNCEVDTFVDSEQTSFGSCAGEYTNIYSWVATDTFGNTATDTRTVSVKDTVPPTILNAPDPTATAECDAVPNAATLSARDDCLTNPLTVEPVRTTRGGTCVDEWTITDTWTATDDCGNTDEVSQVTEVSDTTPPVLVDPTDPTVACDSSVPAWVPSATDNCDTDVSSSLASEVTEQGSCDNEYTLVRVYVSVDNCGNSATQDQTVTVTDSEPPVLNGPYSDTYECAPPAPETLTATDTCGSATVVYDESTVSSTSEYEYVIEREWTATDECGLSTTHVQTVTVGDFTDPVVTGPGDDDVHCHEEFDFGDFTKSDNCGEPTVECTNDQVQGTCEFDYSVVRTCTATDAAGRTSQDSATISVTDTTAPTIFGVGSDFTVEFDLACGWNAECLESGLTGVSATDNCDSVVVDLTEITSAGACPEESTITRTFTAADNCGNVDTAVQVIDIVDNTPCVFSQSPEDATVECDTIPEACELTCEGTPVTFTEGQETAGIITRQWSATDCAGNTATETQTLTIVDTTPPVLSRVPSDLTVECSCDTFPAAAHVIALDNCDTTIDVDFTERKTNVSSEDVYELVRTWTATDDSGNSVTHVQIVTVQDTENPIIANTPLGHAISCERVSDLAAVANYAYDNCDEDPDLNVVSTTEGGSCANAYTLTHTWTATDQSGNAATHVQVNTVVDETAPEVVSSPRQCLTAVENEKFSVAVAGLVTASDACGAATVAVTACTSPQTGEAAFSDACYVTGGNLFIARASDPAIADGRTYHVQITVTDDCGNSEVAQREFSVPADGSTYGCL